MTGRVLLVQHMDDRRDDRVARHLTRRGFALEWCKPLHGDALPGGHTDYEAVVVYGGVQSVNDAGHCAAMRAEIDWIRRWIDEGRAYLGLCLGGQLLARALGARVGPHPEGLHEVGFVPIRATEEGRAFLPPTLHVYQWHHEGFEIPDAGELLASGEVYANQAFRVGHRAFGLQFHAETTARIRGEWMDDSTHGLEAPGAQPRERQETDAKRFDGPMGDWLTGLIDTHLLPAA